VPNVPPRKEGEMHLTIGPRVRIEMIREDRPIYPEPIRGTYDVYALLRDEALKWDREHFLTIALDNKHHVIAIEEVAVGSLTSAIVCPREVMKGLVLCNAAAFVAVHNHCSGQPAPSPEDIAITRRLREAAEIMGIRFLDHVIIGRGKYVSMSDDGYW
jgi:DNA repair protein RadC